jgi:hypothetical protein
VLSRLTERLQRYPLSVRSVFVFGLGNVLAGGDAGERWTLGLSASRLPPR